MGICAPSRARPPTRSLISVIAGPMVLANPIGAALFMTVLLERASRPGWGRRRPPRALRVAERTIEPLARASREVAVDLAAIIQEETGVGAVASPTPSACSGGWGWAPITTARGGPIASPLTRQAIAETAVVFADGVHRYDCPVSPTCPLASACRAARGRRAVVVGTVQLFEPRIGAFSA